MAGLALAALSLVVYLPGFFALPPIDRDEARFAQASRQMVESGDYVVPRIRDVPRLSKPALIYWLQAGSVKAFTGGDTSRDAIWMYRLPSLLGALGAVLLTWRMGCAMFDARAAALGAALLAVCPVVAWEAHQARADMVLLAFTTAGVWLLWECLRRPTPARASALWIAVGFGILVKGPVTPMVILLGALTWCVVRRAPRDLWKIKPPLGLAVVAGIVGPWVYLVGSATGWSTYLGIVRVETLGRSMSPAEGHGGPPGYHAALSFALFFPGSLWVVAGLKRAWTLNIDRDPLGGRRKLRFPLAATPENFLLCILIPSWLVFEVISTKLPHYTLVLYPCLALLTARAALSTRGSDLAWLAKPMVRAGVWGWLVLASGVGSLAALTGVLAAVEGRRWGWTLAILGTACTVAYLVKAARLIARASYRPLLLWSLPLTAISISLSLYALPRLSTPWVVKRLCEASIAFDPVGERPLGFVGLHEDSSIYLTRGRAEWLDDAELASFIAKNPRAMVVMPENIAARWTDFRVLASVRGFNYPKGTMGTWLLGEFQR